MKIVDKEEYEKYHSSSTNLKEIIKMNLVKSDEIDDEREKEKVDENSNFQNESILNSKSPGLVKYKLKFNSSPFKISNNINSNRKNLNLNSKDVEISEIVIDKKEIEIINSPSLNKTKKKDNIIRWPFGEVTLNSNVPHKREVKQKAILFLLGLIIIVLIILILVTLVIIFKK